MSPFLLLGLMANAYQCPDGEIDIAVDVTFVQGFTSRSEEVKADLSSVMAFTAYRLNAIFNYELDYTPLGDIVKFSFYRATDKKSNELPECDGINNCSCNDPLDGGYEWTYDQLQCSDTNSCRIIDEFYAGPWTDLSFRTDVLDAPLDIAQPYLDVPMDDLETGKRRIRVTAILADNCARESGRSTTDPGLRGWYWTGIPENFKDDWSDYPDVDEDGTILDPFTSCDARDYPTMDEFMRAMKRSSTGLVLYWREGTDVCGGTGFDGIDSVRDYYYTYMGNAAERHGVPCDFAAWDDDGDDASHTSRALSSAIARVVDGIACP